MQNTSPFTLEPLLFGHDATLSLFWKAWQNGRLPHAFLFEGPQGIGKCKAALLLGSLLLQHTACPTPPFRALSDQTLQNLTNLCAQDAHPQALLLNPLENKETSMHNFASMMRQKIKSFLNTTSHDDIENSAHFEEGEKLSPHRLCILDNVDMMSYASLCVLLKNIEEAPPGTFFFLIHHKTQPLMSTLRSRCMSFYFQPLKDNDLQHVLKRSVRHHKHTKSSSCAAFFAKGSPQNYTSLLAEEENVLDICTHWLKLFHLKSFHEGGHESVFIWLEKLEDKAPSVFDLALDTLDTLLGYTTKFFVCAHKNDTQPHNAFIKNLNQHLLTLSMQNPAFWVEKRVKIQEEIKEARRFNLQSRMIFVEVCALLCDPLEEPYL